MKRDNLITILILIAGISAIFSIQFLTPTLYGADGYLHIRMAEFLKEFGPRYNFHWARYSTFSERFSDKDFLFHLFLAPFTFFKNIFFGAKLGAAIFASLLLLVFGLILKKYSDKRLFPFFILAFFFSDMFLQAISRPRPISLVILVSLLAIHLMIKKKHRMIFVVALLYSLGHITSPLVILYAAIVETVRYLDKKEFCAKTILAAFLGVLLGFIVHPNVPNNFIVFYLNSILVPIYTIKTGVLELGAEFFPLNTRQFLLNYPVIVIGVISIIYIAISKRPKAKFHTNVFLTLSAFFFVLSFICRRYLGHGYLIMLIAFASYISDALPDLKITRKKMAVLIIPLLMLITFNSYKNVRYNALVANVVNTHYEQVGKWMEANVPEGDLIFHANWSDSQYLIGLNPKNDYFVTLDPVYMYKWNPELYKLYRDVSFGRTSDPYTVLKDTFNIKYGYISRSYFSGLIDQIRIDPKFTVLAEDSLGVIFSLSK